MNGRRAGACLALVLALTGLIGAQSAGQNDKQFQAAVQKEMVANDFKGAIADYRAIATRPGVSRALAAEALLHMADCYRKLGDPEAQKFYQQIVQDYGDQAAAATARARLNLTTSGNDAVRRRLVYSGPDAGSIYPAAAIARDGQSAVYADFRSGELVVYNFANGTSHQITNDAKKDGSGQKLEFADNGAAFSQDARRVAYGWAHSDGPDELRVVGVGAAGIEKSTLLLRANPEISYVAPYEWSPDGQSIVVEIGKPDRSFQLGLVSVRDGRLTILKSTEWQDGANLFLSPDGRWIAFDQPQPRSRAKDIFLLAIDGSKQTQLVDHPADDELMGWSPDGRQVIFASDRSGSLGLWSVAVTAAGSVGVLQRLRQTVDPFTWSDGITRTGDLYTFARGSDAYETKVGAVDVGTGQLTSPPALDKDFWDAESMPAWSPDGQSLAWLTRPRSSPANVFAGPVTLSIRATAGGSVVTWPLVLEVVHPEGVRWTPDGHGLVVFGADGDNRHGIFRVEAQTGAVTHLVASGPIRAGGSPEGVRSVPGESFWSPDGTRIFFTRGRAAEATVVERDLASGREREVYHSQGTVGPLPGRVGPLSPDRERMYLVRQLSPGSGEASLIEVHLQTGREREIVRASGMTEVLLSPDGQSAVVNIAEPATGTASVAVVRIADGVVRTVLKLDSLSRSSGRAWAPDGRSLIVNTQHRQTPDATWMASDSWWVPLDGRAPRKLPPLGEVRISPDGRRLLTRQQASAVPSQIWALEHFLDSKAR